MKSCWKDGNDFGADKWHHECRKQFCIVLRENGDDCGDPWSTWEQTPEYMKAKYKWQLTAETVAQLEAQEEY